MKIITCRLIAFIFLAFSTHYVFGQSDSDSTETELRRFEVGGQFTVLRRSDADVVSEIFSQNGFGSPNYKSEILNEIGVGARVGFNFTKNIAVEAEGDFFRRIEREPSIIGVGIRVDEPGGRKIQVVAGPKIGIRKKKFGVFAKVRPGIIGFERYNVATQIGLINSFFVVPRRRNAKFFNLDVGGVFEYYPTRRTIFRVDAGDTIIYYNPQKPKDLNPSLTRHNFQTSVGFGFRF